MLIITDGLPRGLGYLEIDHRATPADVPTGMRHFEADTYTCSHCNAVVVMNPLRVRERYKCKGCDHHVCDNCAAAMAAGAACKTMKQIVEEHLERETRRLASGSINQP